MLDTDTELFSQLLDYWAWPPLGTPNVISIDSLQEMKLRDLGYIK